MKKRIRLLSVLIGTFVMMVGGNSWAKTIRLVQTELFPLASSSLPHGGFACRVAAAAFALHGHDVRIGWYPVRRAFLMVQNGEADISIGWRKTPEREQLFMFNDTPIVASSVLLYYRKGTGFHWDAIGDLKKYRLGYVIGVESLPDVLLMAEKSKAVFIDRVATFELNIKKLLTHRIDAMIGSPFTTPSQMKRMLTVEERSQIAVYPKPLLVEDYYAVFNKQLPPQLVAEFNDGILQLRRNGKLDRWLTEALEQ